MPVPVFEVIECGGQFKGMWGVDDVNFSIAECDLVLPITFYLPPFKTRAEAQKICDLLTECYKNGRFDPDLDMVKKIAWMIGENPNRPPTLAEALQSSGLGPVGV